MAIVGLLCLLHDTQRNERRDPSHGRKAAHYAQSLRGIWFDLSDAEMDQRCGDRLDLGRVGIKPAPHRLCTASAKSVDVLEAAYERSLKDQKY
jgi:uncharacterized protein